MIPTNYVNFLSLPYLLLASFACFVIIDVSLIALAGPAAPTGLRATFVTHNSVSLTWTEPEFNGGRNDGIFYVIRYKVSTARKFMEYPISSTISVPGATVQNLFPMTSYTFVVVAGNEVTRAYPDVFTFSNAVLRTSREVTVTIPKLSELHLMIVLIYTYADQVTHTHTQYM